MVLRKDMEDIQTTNHKNSTITLAFNSIQNKIRQDQFDMIRSKFPTLQLFPDNTDRNLLTIESGEGSVDYKKLDEELSLAGIRLIRVQKQYPVLGMSCSSCALGIEFTIRKLKGVLSADVNYATSVLTVEYLPGLTDSPAIHKAVKALGYDLLRVSEKQEEEKLDNYQEQLVKDLKYKALLSLVLCIPIVYLGMFGMHWEYSNWITAILSTPILFYFGRDYFIRAWKQALHKNVSMDSLIALSTGVAFFSSLIVLINAYLLQSNAHTQVYFESASVVIGFLLLGRWLEEKARAKTHSALQKLLNLRADKVYVENPDGTLKEKQVSELEEGDLVIVRPGDKISADGTIVKGSTTIDEQLFTGESMPVFKEEGADVFAGTINIQGSFRFVATRTGNETALSKIIQLVKKANASKAPTQKHVDRIARVFVPVVIATALLAFIAWLYFDPVSGFERGLQAFITVLIIACPCALGLATPTALVVAIGKSADHGILVRDAQSLEAASAVQTLVLDKTGTLTKGKPKLTSIFWLEDEELNKPLLFSLAKLSGHPLSKAIAEHFNSKIALTPDQFSDIIGKGIIAQIKTDRYALGSELLMKELQLNIPEEALNFSDHSGRSAESIVWFCRNDQLIALMGLKDEIKEDAKQVVEELKAMNLNLILLTGDRKEAAESVSQYLGLNSFEYNLSPESKTKRIQELQANGQKVGMVGDGINDSAALAQADLSIAIGTGADIAKETAGITIVPDDLKSLIKVFKLSKATVSTIHQNLFWAFIYNVFCIPLAAGAFLPLFGVMLDPMYAGMAMAFSSLSVVANSLRLKLKHI